MENTNEINKKIAKNLSYYRKSANLTQAELAEKINYSDKSVSKWESGNGAPDIYILLQLAELFGVSLNDLVAGDTPEKPKKKSGGLHLLIMLLSSGMVWLVATFFFVTMVLLKPNGSWWLAFLYGVMANAILLVVYASIWHYRFLNFLSTSVLIWISLTCLYLTINAVSAEEYTGLWCVFLLGIPLQVLEVLWAFFRYLFKKRKPQMKATKAEE
ncbi:MAG: helix-turn-helix transcriptional regulator [Clostridia bacterium]|nr:helix-turn-helix transcriptional regulator [Clostridia bacterium]